MNKVRIVTKAGPVYEPTEKRIKKANVTPITALLSSAQSTGKGLTALVLALGMHRSAEHGVLAEQRPISDFVTSQGTYTFRSDLYIYTSDPATDVLLVVD